MKSLFFQTPRRSGHLGPLPKPATLPPSGRHIAQRQTPPSRTYSISDSRIDMRMRMRCR